MKNEQNINKKSSNEEIQKKNSENINKREELEKELGLQRNNKNKNKGPNLSNIKMNQLNYYNEIAKNNIHYLMNNPTIKDIIRITSNESVFDQLKANEQSKDLSKFLDAFPLKRIERINFKYLEIGQIRKDLGLLKKSNANVNYNREKCKQFAENLFEKRKRQGSVNFIPVLTINNINLYNQKNKINNGHQYKQTNNHRKGLTTSNEGTWFKKYKHNTHCPTKNHNIKKDDNENDNIKSDKEIDNLVSARIQVNKYKKIFDMEDDNVIKEQKNKDINGNKKNGKKNIEINTLYNNYNNNIITNQFNNINELNNNNEIPKRTLTTKYPNKFNLNQNENDYEKNNKLPGDKKMLLHNCFSSNDIRSAISIPETKNESKQNNDKGSLVKNIEIGEIKVKKKEEKIKNKANGKKKLIRKNPGYHSQTKLKTKGLITS